MKIPKQTFLKLAFLPPVIQGYSIGTYNRHVSPEYVIPTTEHVPTAFDSNTADPEFVSSMQETTKTTSVDPANAVVVGNRYVISADDPKQSSGKSAIFEAFPKDDQGGLMLDYPVVVKLSPNTNALEREAHNYLTITRGPGGIQTADLFVEVHDYLEKADPNCPDLRQHSALIIERGENDLQHYLQKNGCLQGKELQDAAKTAVMCVKAVHDNNMVWTEIKTSNFVLTNDCSSSTEGEKIKGIDLESAVPHSHPAIDYTAYACPPEFALEFLCGRQAEMPMDYSFDVWSLGMLLYEMSTGTPFFHPDDDNVYIATTLKNMNGKLDLNKNGDEAILNQDPPMKDLIQQCLEMDPHARSSVNELLHHEYFAQSR